MKPAAVLLTAAALGAPLAVGAQSLDLPSRKAGLWEVVITMERPNRLPAVTTKVCLDERTDRELMDHGLKLVAGKCKSLTPRRQGQSYVIDMDCKLGSAASKTRTVITGDLGSAYILRVEDGSGAGKRSETTLMTQSATWKSADCPGMKPGDMTMPGGLKVNVKQLKALSGLIK